VGRNIGPGHAATGDGTNARDELAEPEGLHDVVVGAEFEADDPVHLLRTRGHDDDRHVGTGAQLAAHVEAVDVGEAEVEQHHVDGMVVGVVEAASERVGTGLHPVDVEALALEPLRERGGDGVVVFDDQYSHGTSSRARRASRRAPSRVDRHPDGSP